MQLVKHTLTHQAIPKLLQLDQSFDSGGSSLRGRLPIVAVVLLAGRLLHNAASPLEHNGPTTHQEESRHLPPR